MSTPNLALTKRQTILTRGLLLVAVYIVGYAITLLLSAGSFYWPEAWVFIALFIVYFIVWLWWGLKNNPDLLLERAQSMSGKGKPWDTVLVRVNLLVSLITYLVAGLDAVRYGWSMSVRRSKSLAFSC